MVVISPNDTTYKPTILVNNQKEVEVCKLQFLDFQQEQDNRVHRKLILTRSKLSLF